MSRVRELHSKAMTLAHLALVARESGQHDRAAELATQAYEYETQAADLIPLEESSEPTRSILYSSAASLAYQGRRFDEALHLIAKGLSGYPPSQIKEELKSLWQQVSFEDHLREHGVALTSEDLEISLSGNVVGSGMVYYDEFLRRIQALHSILSRTIQRKMRRDYQRSGRLAGMYKYFTPALSVPRAGSFAITLRLGLPLESQTTMFFSASEIIDEILTGVEYINKGDTDSLRQLIGEEAYYLNFVTQARRVAPDGDNIRMVSLSSTKKSVGLTRVHRDISVGPKTDIPDEDRFQRVNLKGVLDYAKSRGKDMLGFTTDDGRPWYVYVHAGMDDLVRSYFDERVSVTGSFDTVHKKIYLTDIEPTED